MIELDGVSRRFGAGPPALDEVTLRVARGESVAVVGPSGSGKSTLLNMLAGLDRPDRGRVTVDGTRVDRLSEAAAARFRRTRTGLVFQFFNLLDDLTVADNVMLPAAIAGTRRDAARRRAAELLERLGIAALAGRYPNGLSGGERQRVGVARALMNQPALLLADEPTGALDSAAAAEVSDMFAELHAQGQTIVLVTHDRALAGALATRTVELLDGRTSAAETAR
jgi:putative ABC transport system ATP-binding protein